MKKAHRILLAAAILVMTYVLTVGYAALSDTLSITGSATAEGKPFKGVYIKSVELASSSYASSTLNDFVLPTNHKSAADASRSGGYVVYRITVHNNTDVTYWYVGQQYTDDYEQNALLGTANGITVTTRDQSGDSNGTFNTDDWVPPQTERVFYAVYTYGSSAQNACSTLVNFRFDIRMDAVHDEFLAVLNNVKAPDSYEQLASVFNAQYAQNGSVTITTESHPEVFAALFEDLMVNIDGVERQASVVIRRENMDKKDTGDDYTGSGSSTTKGCEYTLYITVEPLTPGTRPTVYAIAYSEGASGMGSGWYQVGELYEGTAPIKSDGTIDYANWTATHKEYEIADGITYLVGAPNGDQYDIMKTMEQLISAEDQDIFNQIDNTNIFKKVYDILQKHSGSTDPAVEGLRKAFTDASIFYRNLNNGQEFKVVRGTYTRAEIIYALKNIQSALDYYNQTYGS